MITDKGKEIRVGSLQTHGPYQDLLDIMWQECDFMAKDVVNAEGNDDILLKCRRARGFADAVRFMRDRVESYASAHSLSNVVL